MWYHHQKFQRYQRRRYSGRIRNYRNKTNFEIGSFTDNNEEQKKIDFFQWKDYLDELVDKVNVLGFIPDDPISVPHSFTSCQDIEISGFFSAIFSWGNRKTIINKSKELMALMDNDPYQFILHHTEKERSKFLYFKHRTFQATDILYCLDFLQRHYRVYSTLENAFYPDHTLLYDQGEALQTFHTYFFDNPFAPQRTKKHISTPAKNSTCKRLNMYLRWMVRDDDRKVDFGIWKNIPTSELMIPLDVHVEKYARHMGILTRRQIDWGAVKEITQKLRMMDKYDPIKYDYALFGLGVYGNDILLK